jgi:hypothetical protein
LKCQLQSAEQELLDHCCDGSIHTPDRRQQREQADIDGAAIRRMFKHVVSGQWLPKHLSTDHDPLFRFDRWRANLRVLDLEKIKTVPFLPCSHPFIERLIGTILTNMP